MKPHEFDHELRLEREQEEQELLNLRTEYDVPNWAYLDDDNSAAGYYTGNAQKTLKQHRKEVNKL